MMKEVPNGTHMIGEIFRERQRFSDEPRDPLSEGAIKPFDVISLARFFTDGPMAFRGQHRFIGGPEIGIADRALAINGG